MPRRPTLPARLVEERGGLLPDVGLLALLFAHPGDDEEAVAENPRVLEGLGQFGLDRRPVDVRRRRRQAVLVEHGAHGLWLLAEEPRELDLLEPDRGDLAERPGDIGLHQVAHRIQLHADRAELALRERGSRKRRGGRGGEGRLEEGASVHDRYRTTWRAGYQTSLRSRVTMPTRELRLGKPREGCRAVARRAKADSGGDIVIAKSREGTDSHPVRGERHR